jgi:homoserine O-acetyltransferase
MNEPSRRAPLSADLLPASGAWRPGDPVGGRSFAAQPSRSFVLEGGGVLHGAQIAFETWGELDADAANAVLVCHALTGDSHAAGRSGPGHPTEGWWDGLIGPGRALDTDRWFVVCANVLGGCQGSTGPSSDDPATGAPYGSTFPVVTIRDIVRSQSWVADHLGVQRWLAVIGGSMGGMQALEWAVMYPDRVASTVALATTAAASAQQIALSSVQRSAVVLDPAWRGGDYYGAGVGDGPHQGLAIAREMAQITYRTEEVYAGRFGRKQLDPLDDRFTLWQRFDVEGYLDYQGAKLARRFDANSYLVINRAMDLHDLARGRAGLAGALARVRGPVLTMSITSDALYPSYQQQLLHDLLTAVGVDSELEIIDSPHGHDAFLIETEQVGAALAPFLADVEKSIR